MKNQIYKVFAILAVFFGLAVVSVHAQAPSRVEVQIPFEFSAGQKVMKPGVYTIKRLSGDLLMIRRSDGKSVVIVNASQSLTSSNPNSVERLVFDKHGEQLLLSQIWLTADTGRELFVDRNTTKPERVELSLRTRR